MLSNLTQGSLRFTLGYVPPPPLGAKRLRYPVVTTQEFLSVQVDQRPVLMFSYILKRIKKGRAGILPAIYRGRLFCLAFCVLSGWKPSERLQEFFVSASPSHYFSQFPAKRVLTRDDRNGQLFSL